MAFTRLRGILVPAVLLSACLLSPLAAAEPTVAQLEKKINARNAALLEMQKRVQQQDATIRKLEGQIQDLSERLSALEKGGVRPQIPANPNPPAPDTASSGNNGPKPQPDVVPAPDAKKPAGDPKKLYDDSFAFVRDNNFRKAEAGFSELIQNYPDSDLVPNSYYWLGQIYYKEKQYQKARENFLNVTKYKSCQKRADSIYKLGAIEELLKNPDKAKKFYQVVVNSYKGSAEAVLAQKALDRLK